MSTPNDDEQKASAEALIARLEAGNERFVSGGMLSRDLMHELQVTSAGQYPVAAVVYCMDSRVSAGLIFDQGLGDLFEIRVAGNVINADVLGSLEYATKLVGVQLILVLGHTCCGAIKGACDHIRMGHLSEVIKKIEPAVAAVTDSIYDEDRSSKNDAFVDAVAVKQVMLSLAEIQRQSELLRDMIAEQELVLLGGMYDISTGRVRLIR